jgi:hypothetical protein
MSRIADWPWLFGYIVTATGWSLREVEALTLREANDLLAYWSEHPPAHVLLGALVQARPLRKTRDLASAVAGVGGRVSAKPSAAISTLLKSEHERKKA